MLSTNNIELKIDQWVIYPAHTASGTRLGKITSIGTNKQFPAVAIQEYYNKMWDIANPSIVTVISEEEALLRLLESE